MGLIATGAGLGAMVVPWLMSAVSQWTDLKVGFLFFEIFVLACFALLAVNQKSLKPAG
jgi:nitrate/nitrite transporter NarK